MPNRAPLDARDDARPSRPAALARTRAAPRAAPEDLRRIRRRAAAIVALSLVFGSGDSPGSRPRPQLRARTPRQRRMAAGPWRSAPSGARRARPAPRTAHRDAARAARGSRGGTRRLPHRARGRADGTGHVGERDRRGELRLDHPAGPAPGGTARRAGRISCRRLYVFGGGDGVRQLDHILRIDPRSGAVSTVGRLPAASSDASAASIGSTAYVVGGYTGTRWLDTIVAVRPGGSARAVAHLPVGLRYAAVAASGTSLVIAGGSLADGSASRAVYRFDTRSSRVQRIASLPTGTTHAAAASLRGTVFVIGGRGATAGSVTAAIVAIDPGSGRIASGGRLRTARSDLAAVTVGDQIVIAGGGTAHGVTAAVSALRPAAAQTIAAPLATPSASTNVYAADRANRLTGRARAARALVYVPNSQSNTLDVIDQHS